MPVSFGAVKFQHVGVVEFYRTFEFPNNVLINFLLAFSNFLIYKSKPLLRARIVCIQSPKWGNVN